MPRGDFLTIEENPTQTVELSLLSICEAKEDVCLKSVPSIRSGHYVVHGKPTIS